MRHDNVSWIRKQACNVSKTWITGSAEPDDMSLNFSKPDIQQA